MSDKGREGIALIYDGLVQEVDMTVEDIERILRSHGWLHEDDVVEGVWKCTLDKYCEMKERNGICHHNITKCPNRRPATIKDLTGRE